MILFKQAAALTAFLAKEKEAGVTTGFTPTMGALHEGHLSLVAASRRQNGLTVSSIFVNPTQFNNAADFEKYPVTIEKDIDMLEAAGCDILFLPSVSEIYPGGMLPQRKYELGHLEEVLEGRYRPGHFQGVCQVVHRLLDIVQPTRLYLGQKDYQQCMVLKKLLDMLAMPAELVICPTLREPGGLAMSSRNMRLSPAEREQARHISQTLQWLKEALQPGPLEVLKQSAVAMLEQADFRTDYVEVATADSLELVEHWDGHTPLVVLAAAFLGEVRLIDNMLVQAGTVPAL